MGEGNGASESVERPASPPPPSAAPPPPRTRTSTHPFPPFRSHPPVAPGDVVAVILAGGASLDANPLAKHTAPAALKLGA